MASFPKPTETPSTASCDKAESQVPSSQEDRAHTLELAFAVASLQNPGGIGSSVSLGVQHIPQSLQELSSESDDFPAPKRTKVNHTGDVKDGSVFVRSDTEDFPARNRLDAVAEEGEAGDDAEKRLARSRERNREHARRTRLRKKAQLEALQSQVKGLEAERQVLRQSMEECGIATILLGLSSGEQDMRVPKLFDHDTTDASSADLVALLSGNKRKRFLSELQQQQQIVHPDIAGSNVNCTNPLTIVLDGKATVIGTGKSHINWKTGVYTDEKGTRRQLTSQQLEDLRRERNRMHAKMTRSRKKCFIATIERAIEDLQCENNRMRSILQRVSSTKFAEIVTPASSPEMNPSQGPEIPPQHGEYEEDFIEHRNGGISAVSHGFVLDG